MKPDWDKLMDAFAGSETQLVADVDCTAEGKDLCNANDVKGYPTIKWGDPSALEDYKGGRDFNSLKKFADENLKPVCSPANIDLCDAAKKAEIEKFQTLESKELDSLIAAEESKIEAAEANFKKEVEKLQAKYQSLMADKEKTAEDVKKSGLGLMKSVKAHKKKAASGGKDEL